MTKVFYKNKITAVFLLFLIVLAFQSCGVNSNMLLKTPRSQYASLDSLPTTIFEDYKISVNDKVMVKMTYSQGDDLTFVSSTVNQIPFEYVVMTDGTIDLPDFGKIKVDGLSIKACEDSLEYIFAKYYKKPYVQVAVTNQRVLVFNGNGGSASVYTLVNQNTTLMEVLASSGGLTERGRANSIKLIRKEETGRKIYLIDISTIEGLKYTDILVRANDYIYVDPKPQLLRGVMQEITPFMSAISIVMFSLNLFKQ